MRNFTFQKGNNKYSLDISYLKYCIGMNDIEKYKFKQILIESLNGSKESEYSISNSGKAKFFIDNKEASHKNIYFVNVDHNFSILDNLKLSSKSLVTKYLEVLMSDIEYIDTINSINILLEAFGQELDDRLFTSRFATYTPKLFLKILMPMFIKEETQANEYDLDYNERILFQLAMIDYLSKNDVTQEYMCLLEIPLLTKEIKDYLDKMRCVVIVIVNRFKVLPKLSDIYLFDKKVVDLNNEEDIYSIFIQKGICTLEEAKKEMERLLEMEMKKLDMSIFDNK